MKAKEYFEKYRHRIMDPLDVNDENGPDAISQLFIDMSSEFKNICKTRGVKTDSGAISVMKELNQKEKMRLLNS